MNRCTCGLALAFVCLQLCACVGPLGATMKTSIADPRHDDPQQTKLIGKTKAEVVAQFGETRSLHFDSGYEVWIYRFEGDGKFSLNFRQVADRLLLGKGTLGDSEFIVLFDPAGVVTKTRIRSEAPAPS